MVQIHSPRPFFSKRYAALLVSVNSAVDNLVDSEVCSATQKTRSRDFLFCIAFNNEETARGTVGWAPRAKDVFVIRPALQEGGKSFWWR